MGDPLDSAQDLSTELQQLRCFALELQRELLAQKSKEAGLATSLAHFTALSHMLQLGLLFEDAARRITFANEAFCAMFGVAGPDCLIGLDGRAAAERVQTLCADPARFLSQIDRAVAGQVPVNGEEIRLADGRWLVQDYAPVMVDGTCAGHVWSYRDMTERKRTEMALSESEARFRTMGDTAPVLIWVAGPDKLCTYFNQGWLDYTGRTLEQELGNGWAEGVHPDDLARCLNTYEEAFDSRKPFRMEYRLRKANSEYGWILDTGTPRWFPNGRFAGYIGSGIDITERKQFQEAQERSRALLQTFVEHTPAAVAMFDKDLRYLAVSKRWLLDYHLGERNIIGLHHYDVFPEIREMKEWQEIHQRCLAGAVERREEDPFLRADGSMDWLRWEVRPWHDEAGAIGGIIMFTEVITERKRAEESLRESEARFRQVTENIREVFWLTDPGKNEMVYISPGYEQLWGRTRASLYQSPRSWLEAIHPDDRERVLKAAVTKQVPGTYDEEYRIVRPDGSMRWIRDRAFPVLDDAGVVLRIAGLAEDITERKQAEEALRRSYEERDRISQDLHDGILQSLYAIGLGLEATKRDVKPASQAMVQRLDGSLVQLNALVQEVRSFITRMTEPGGEVRDLVQAIQALTGSFAAMGAGEIAVQLDPAIAASFSSVQSAHLVNIVKEALSNSVRHAHAAHRSVTLGRSREGIRLEIRDDGVGFRVNQQRGAGMGLSTMRARAKKLGGRLSILSRPGCGTRVVLDLPSL